MSSTADFKPTYYTHSSDLTTALDTMKGYRTELQRLASGDRLLASAVDLADVFQASVEVRCLRGLVDSQEELDERNEEDRRAVIHAGNISKHLSNLILNNTANTQTPESKETKRQWSNSTDSQMIELERLMKEQFFSNSTKLEELGESMKNLQLEEK